MIQSHVLHLNAQHQLCCYTRAHQTASHIKLSIISVSSSCTKSRFWKQRFGNTIYFVLLVLLLFTGQVYCHFEQSWWQASWCGPCQFITPTNSVLQSLREWLLESWSHVHLEFYSNMLMSWKVYVHCMSCETFL